MLRERSVDKFKDLGESEVGTRSRNYVVRLPDIPRRFKIIAGLLELADNEFERLSKETQAYAKPIPSKIMKGDLEIPISAYSLRQFLTIRFKDIPGFSPYFGWIEDELNELELQC